ncbi:YcgN family cysteine cluster protein [Aliikangiella sp. G2MR2-5]|uniref:YcgN family cysteine cluster protein n=1 Tax=Aliikangiella sp. G2MR2-5 TaxID=2788943 RepID=UPI0018A8A577|nr:YcgN family cysteine cluster protein [Aliikangiella sp. G2MR2-5]
MNDNSSDTRFWERIPLTELSEKQWESICDGCCQCCAHKLIDDDTGELFKTNIVCQYLDTQECSCTVYSERHTYVPDCIKVTPENAKALEWFPNTCGYKLLANGKPLPEWHPLETGKPDSTKLAGRAVTGKVISEADINEDDIEDYIVEDEYFDKD